MKKIIIGIMVFMALLFVAGCTEEDGMKGSKTVGKDISESEIAEFIYTYSNINYNAFYQRYQFTTEDGKHMFFHETRQREGEYGPATEEDVTNSGFFEISDEVWNEFFDIVSGGTVKLREDSAESGDSGPWTYLYSTGKYSMLTEYSFESSQKEAEFEEFCRSMSENG
ncbi:MAG: hypothetical protein IJL30_05110 [Clostridia bacterium]|nr:hypothetical protein [Clostridia bacterium]